MTTFKAAISAVVIVSGLPVAASEFSRDSAGAYFSAVPVVITGGEWTTVIVVGNPGDAPATFTGTFYRDGAKWRVGIKPTDGQCNPCQPTAEWRFTLASSASFRFELTKPESTEVGYLELYSVDSSAKAVTVQSFLRNHHPARAQDFEVTYQVAPLMDVGPKRIVFDQMNYSQVVVNVTNTGDNPRALTFRVNWSDGTSENIGHFEIAPHSVRIINFASSFKQTWNRYGLLIADYGYSDGLTVTAHRINETGSFTPLVPFNF